MDHRVELQSYGFTEGAQTADRVQEVVTRCVELHPVGSVMLPSPRRRNRHADQTPTARSQQFEDSGERRALLGNVLERVMEHDQIELARNIGQRALANAARGR